MPAVRSRLLAAGCATGLLLLAACTSGSQRSTVATTLASTAASSSSSVPAKLTAPRAAIPSTTAARQAPRVLTSRAPASPPPPPLPVPMPVGQTLSLGYPTGDAQQALTVVAASTASTTASVQAWQKSGAGWARYGPAIAAHLGAGGMTDHPSESLSATPMGSYTLSQAFGSAPNPGTRLAYFQTVSSDWWVSDAASRFYNTHVRCAGSCPFDTSAGENLADAGAVYTYAVVIDYNRFPVTPGAGSAFFLHVTDGGATAGCVSMPESQLRSIMQWLDPAKHPRVLIGTS